VEIEGAPYWDGGYSGNPPLFPLFSETDCADVLLIQINPILRAQTPTTPTDIMNRLNEITFNAPLLGEFRAIEFVGRLISDGALSPTHYKKVNMHLIAGGEALAQFPASTKTRAEFGFIKKLFGLGRAAGAEFLANHFEAIGQRSTFELRDEL
jgi:NTE family protein